MAIILTNDDGIEAPGIRSLHTALTQLVPQSTPEHQMLIIAPRLPHSGCGHQVTTHRPIQVDPRSDGEYAIDGTPADCTRVALNHLCDRVEWVLSGVNAGGNLGADIYVSGTVAAVREAAFYRVPGIAISQYMRKGHQINWEITTQLTVKVLDKLLHLPIEPGSFWNVNLPFFEAGMPEPEIVFCPLCTQPLPGDYRVEGEHLIYVGEYGQRQRDPDSDVAVCFGGRIAVSQVRI